MKPLLTASVMSQRDDEMYNVNVGTGYLMPGYGNSDFFAFKYIEKILGNTAFKGSSAFNKKSAKGADLASCVSEGLVQIQAPPPLLVTRATPAMATRWFAT